MFKIKTSRRSQIELGAALCRALLGSGLGVAVGSGTSIWLQYQTSVIHVCFFAEYGCNITTITSYDVFNTKIATDTTLLLILQIFIVTAYIRHCFDSSHSDEWVRASLAARKPSWSLTRRGFWVPVSRSSAKWPLLTSYCLQWPLKRAQIHTFTAQKCVLMSFNTWKKCPWPTQHQQGRPGWSSVVKSQRDETVIDLIKWLPNGEPVETSVPSLSTT